MAAKKGLSKHDLPTRDRELHAELFDGVRQIASWIGNSQVLMENAAPDRAPPPARRPRRDQRVKRPRPRRCMGNSLIRLNWRRVVLVKGFGIGFRAVLFLTGPRTVTYNLANTVFTRTSHTHFAQNRRSGCRD